MSPPADPVRSYHVRGSLKRSAVLSYWCSSVTVLARRANTTSAPGLELQRVLRRKPPNWTWAASSIPQDGFYRPGEALGYRG